MNVSASNTKSPTLLRSLGPESRLLLAVILFGLTVRGNSSGAALAAILATVVVGLVLWSQRHEQSDATPHDPGWESRLFAAVLIFAVLGVVGYAPSAIGATSIWLERGPAVAWGILGVILFLDGRDGGRRRVEIGVMATTLVVTLVVGLLHIDAVEGMGLDVLLLHTEAAEAIATGQNPYTSAVEVPDGSPLAEPGAVITGYPYPPVTALAYSVGVWAIGDARYVSLLCWLLLLGMMGVAGIRSRSRSILYLTLLLASLPGWPLVLRAGWTEPLSLFLVGVALFTWAKATSSGLALGLGLASKQYFAVTAPLALLHRDDGWVRRLVFALVAVVLTIVPAMLLDFDAFWSAAIEFHTSTPPRPDSANLVGLLSGLGVSWAPAAILPMAVGLAAAVLFGWTSRNRHTFMTVMAFTLGASFLFSSQAFANYWYLVTGITVLGLAGRYSSQRDLEVSVPQGRAGG